MIDQQELIPHDSRNQAISNLSKISKDQFLCPCCHQHCSEWLDYSSSYQNVVCPNCRSHPRHRALQLYLEKHTNFYQRQLKVLHFAPEPIFRDRFNNMPNINYITADLNGYNVDFHIDITKIPSPKNTFDVIFCSHVLEHVPDDHQAMVELYRILKPGGWAFLQVPIARNRQMTLEDESIVTPKQRRKYYWQEDHVRLYGRDYPARLKQAGFIVKVEKPQECFSSEEITQHGLQNFHSLYFGFKPQA